MSEAFVTPSPSQLAAFASLADEGPINMVNFLRYRDAAAYPAGHEHADKGWTGRQAYQEYGRGVAPIFARIGASVLWNGRFQATVIGPDGESWDDLLIAQYPDAKTFMTMVMDPEYQAVSINRTAAIADSRLFRTKPGQVPS